MILSLSSKTKVVKPVKIPKSIAFAAEKTKSRIVKAVPGRYILKNRKGMFVIVRFKEETRYTASVGTKLFSTSSVDMPEVGLESESESNQPGARNSAAGNKLGKKNHAKGMMATGWWLFRKGADGKMQKAYIGGRISGRRLLGLLDPATVKTEEPKKPRASGKKVSSPDELIAKLPVMQKNYAEHIIETHLKDVKYYSSAKAEKDYDQMKDTLNSMYKRDKELQGQSDSLKTEIMLLEGKLSTHRSKIAKFKEEGKLFKKDPEAYIQRTKIHALDWTKNSGYDINGMIKANEGKVPESKIKALQAKRKAQKKVGGRPDLTNLTSSTRSRMAYEASKKNRLKSTKPEIKFGKH